MQNELIAIHRGEPAIAVADIRIPQSAFLRLKEQDLQEITFYALYMFLSMFDPNRRRLHIASRLAEQSQGRCSLNKVCFPLPRRRFSLP